MQKIDSLRAALTAALPDLKVAPKNLRMWVDRGNGMSRSTNTYGVTFAFRLNVLLVDFAADIKDLAVALFAWLRVNQPGLLHPGSKGFDFEADFLDNQKADLLIQLDLTQVVSAQPKPGGGFTTSYLAEPDPLTDDELPFGGGPDFPPLFPIQLCGEGNLQPDGTITEPIDLTDG